MFLTSETLNYCKFKTKNSFDIFYSFVINFYSFEVIILIFLFTCNIKQVEKAHNLLGRVHINIVICTLKMASEIETR